MKRNSVCVLLFLILFIFTGPSAAVSGGCKAGSEMLDFALSVPPDGMTQEYINMAIDQCKGDTAIIKRVAAYYEKCYKEEINPEKQAAYKKSAQKYYQMAAGNRKSDEKKDAAIALARLDNSKEFNEATFRSLKPVAIGSTGSGLELKVHFASNSHNLSNGVQGNLDTLGHILTSDSNIKISLEGHTDVSGTDSYNQELSMKRAESVRNYLVSKYEIAPTRINITGYGYDRLLDQNDPYSKKNRRVEVLKISE